jgi:hypothetical protein
MNGMNLLILILVLLLIVGMALYAVDLIPLDARLRNLLKLAVIMIAIIFLAEQVL